MILWSRWRLFADWSRFPFPWMGSDEAEEGQEPASRCPGVCDGGWGPVFDGSNGGCFGVVCSADERSRGQGKAEGFAA